MLVEIFYILKQGTITSDNLIISVNGNFISYTDNQSALKCNLHIDHGLHNLQIYFGDNVKIEITDVKIAGSSLRQFLYLSWLEYNNTKIQPCTENWEPDQTWVLPFGYPVSAWFDCVFENIPQDLIGQNLFDHYEIFYPTSIVLPKTYPTLIKDFFKYNQSFTVAKKGNLKSLPFTKLNINLDTEVLKKLAKSSIDHYNNKTFFHLAKTPAQAQYNVHEDPNWNKNSWNSLTLAKYSIDNKQLEMNVNKDQWPELYDFLDVLQLQEVDNIHIMYLEPGWFVAPHRDPATRSGSVDASGLEQLYVPLYCKPGNYIKLSRAGLIDSSKSAVAIDHVNYTHSIVNTSDDIRSMLTVRCNVDANKHLFY